MEHQVVNNYVQFYNVTVSTDVYKVESRLAGQLATAYVFLFSHEFFCFFSVITVSALHIDKVPINLAPDLLQESLK